ncbi:hypothetical protein G6F56_013474 [Rhizopus delemar]|nr:hypothetical protein G6F56_013474 [Rhizopus delemar]
MHTLFPTETVYQRGQKAANARYHLSLRRTQRVEKAAKPRTEIQRRNAANYLRRAMKKEATDFAEHLRATVLSNWEKTVERLGGLSKTRVLHEPFAVKYYEEITKGLTAVAGGLRAPDTYYNRVSIIKLLLTWLNLAFPLTISRDYNEKVVIPMLVACDPETMADLDLDLQMGEHSEKCCV